MQYPYYKIFNISDKNIVNKIITLSGLPLITSTLRVEVDFMEESAIIYTDDILIPVNYKLTKELLNAYL